MVGAALVFWILDRLQAELSVDWAIATCLAATIHESDQFGEGAVALHRLNDLPTGKDKEGLRQLGIRQH